MKRLIRDDQYGDYELSQTQIRKYPAQAKEIEVMIKGNLGEVSAQDLYISGRFLIKDLFVLGRELLEAAVAKSKNKNIENIEWNEKEAIKNAARVLSNVYSHYFDPSNLDLRDSAKGSYRDRDFFPDQVKQLGYSGIFHLLNLAHNRRKYQQIDLSFLK